MRHIGEQIWSADGSWGAVEQLALRSDPQPMYNLTVATAHTYFVGEGQWLVHNTCWPPSFSKNKSLRETAEKYTAETAQCTQCAKEMVAELQLTYGQYEARLSRLEYGNPHGRDFIKIYTRDGRLAGQNGYHDLVEVTMDGKSSPLYLDSEIFLKNNGVPVPKEELSRFYQIDPSLFTLK